MATGDHSSPRVWQARVTHGLRACAIIFVAGALAWASARHHSGADWTAGSRHTLSNASVAVLRTVPGPVVATAYVPDEPVQRNRITSLFLRYQRHRSDLELRLIDPAEVPDVMRIEGLRDGEIALRAGERTEIVREHSEKALTNALARLARNSERWIAFVTGHGERDPSREANHDLSSWATTLADRGLRTGKINLAASTSIPDNTSVLVVASPRLGYLPGEIELIAAYVDAGGNLLWLTEPDAPEGMDELARRLGIERIPGTILDPVTPALGIDNPAVAVVTAYGEHAAVNGFDVVALLPYAAALHERPGPGWSAARLFSSGDRAWSETGRLTGNVGLDAGTDYPGPLPLAVALSRPASGPPDGREQRVIVVGDGDFLANSYIDNGGNRDLGIRIVEWLANEDAFVTVPAYRAIDTTLELRRSHGIAIGVGFLFVLPLALAANGLLIWWRRRHA